MLTQAVDTALAKIGAASPKDLRQEIGEIGLWAPRFGKPTRHTTGLHVIREAIRREHKLHILYTSLAETETERVIWPVALAFFEGVQLVAAWCELRADFQHFRVDRIASLETLGIPYPRTRKDLARQWEQARASERPRGREPLC
ncbi:MAG: helix-turn-helix transcriptional regulator [Acidiferrobacter sp.]